MGTWLHKYPILLDRLRAQSIINLGKTRHPKCLHSVLVFFFNELFTMYLFDNDFFSFTNSGFKEILPIFLSNDDNTGNNFQISVKTISMYPRCLIMTSTTTLYSDEIFTLFFQIESLIVFDFLLLTNLYSVFKIINSTDLRWYNIYLLDSMK